MDYITTSRVARELGVSEAAVRKLADAGSLPVAAKLSDGTRLFDPAAVTAYVAQRPSQRAAAGLSARGRAVSCSREAKPFESQHLQRCREEAVNKPRVVGHGRVPRTAR